MPSPVSDTGGVTPSKAQFLPSWYFLYMEETEKIKPGNYSSVISAVRQVFMRLLGTTQEEYFTQTWG